MWGCIPTYPSSSLYMGSLPTYRETPMYGKRSMFGKTSPHIGSPHIYGKTSHVLEVFPYVESLATYGETSQDGEDPCMGRLTIHGKTCFTSSCHVWGDFPCMEVYPCMEFLPIHGKSFHIPGAPLDYLFTLNTKSCCTGSKYGHEWAL